ncbi:MAG: 50S ribosomal protein L29 [Candidatus Woesearchaeota archaeon]
MKYKELKSMGMDDLNTKLVELQKELMKQNTQRATGTQLKKPTLIRGIKKDIARIKSAQALLSYMPDNNKLTDNIINQQKKDGKQL